MSQRTARRPPASCRVFKHKRTARRVGNRDLPAAAGVCPSWFPRSRQVHMEWEDFQLAWCVGGVVARADQAAAPNGQPTLTFLLDASTV